MNIEFVELVKGYLSKDDTVSILHGVMRIVGVPGLVRNAVPDPRAAKLRQEHTARYWVVQTME